MLAATPITATATVFLLSRIPQDLAYHNFADQRVLLGIPNCLNVISNFPFLLVGAWGLFMLMRSGGSGPNPCESNGTLAVLVLLCRRSAHRFRLQLLPPSPRERPTRLGPSADDDWFHGAGRSSNSGTNQRQSRRASLGAFVAPRDFQCFLLESYGMRRTRRLAPVRARAVRLPAGHPAADRGLSVAIHARQRYVISLAIYALAKIFEAADRPIFALGHIVSGHTLKHFAAAASACRLLRMLRLRTPIPRQAL